MCLWANKPVGELSYLMLRDTIIVAKIADLRGYFFAESVKKGSCLKWRPKTGGAVPRFTGLLLSYLAVALPGHIKID